MITYELIDSGNYKKLEKIGKIKIIRPSLNSPYPPKNPDLWRNCDAEFDKGNGNSTGEWIFYKNIPNEYIVTLNRNIKVKIKFTPFGHLGIFPEQHDNWNLLNQIGEKKKDLSILNLFAYSGISTLYAARAGMEVCHVDSSKGMVDWARDNAKLSNLENSNIRWIVDDVSKFLKREIRRGKKYNGVILDPPSFGRGSKGEVWKIEKDLISVFDLIVSLTGDKPDFIFLSCHTTGFGPLILERILRMVYSEYGVYDNKELYIGENSGMKLSGGFCGYYFDSSLYEKLNFKGSGISP